MIRFCQGGGYVHVPSGAQLHGCRPLTRFESSSLTGVKFILNGLEAEVGSTTVVVVVGGVSCIA